MQNIAESIVNSYEKAPRKGKPNNEEWTILAGISCKNNNENNKETILALSTGLKSTPDKQLESANGTILHDCHAEILCIRAFNLFLLNQVKLYLETLKTTPSHTTPDNHNNNNFSNPFLKYNPNDNLFYWIGGDLSLFVSEIPCGDASMELLVESSDDKSPWIDQDRSFSIDSEFFARGREFFWRTGIVRTKPGRGDSIATLSKSCSDKLAMRQFSSLLLTPLTTIISPVYLKNLILPDIPQSTKNATRRAWEVTGRLKELSYLVDSNNPYSFHPFSIHFVKQPFKHCKPNVNDEIESRPCPSGIIYIPSMNINEAIIKGIKMGSKVKIEEKNLVYFNLNKSVKSQASYASCLSRFCITKVVLEILLDLKNLNGVSIIDTKMTSNNPFLYSYFKQSQPEKRKKIKKITREALKAWPPTSSDDFYINICE